MVMERARANQVGGVARIGQGLNALARSGATKFLVKYFGGHSNFLVRTPGRLVVRRLFFVVALVCWCVGVVWVGLWPVVYRFSESRTINNFPFLVLFARLG